MNEKSRAFRAAIRTDFSSFIQKAFSTVDTSATYRHNWHIDAIAWALGQCRAGKIRRLIITLPPRNLKSICVSVAFPAFILGHDPTRRIIAVSYSDDLARKHSRDCRAVMTADWYRLAFPQTRLNPSKLAEQEFATMRGGFRLATSTLGTLTGIGGNIIIIDDPMKPTEAMSQARREAVKQWYDNTLYSRLDSKTDDVIIIVMQRLHVDDLVGHVLEQEEWVHLNLPAIAEEKERVQIGRVRFHERKPGEALHTDHEPLKVLERQKRVIGSYNFSAQYQQMPTPPGGAMIRWEWFRFYDNLPERGPNDRIIQSWDTASKADEIHDYSVCLTFLEHDNLYYLLHVHRERLEFPELRRRVATMADVHRADAVLIEDKGSGTQLIQDLLSDGPLRPIGIVPEGDKITRMHAMTPHIEAGYVLLPTEAPWLHEFETEVLQFPLGRHDDQVDSLSQFLQWVSDRPGKAVFHVS